MLPALYNKGGAGAKQCSNGRRSIAPSQATRRFLWWFCSSPRSTHQIDNPQQFNLSSSSFKSFHPSSVLSRSSFGLRWLSADCHRLRWPRKSSVGSSLGFRHQISTCGNNAPPVVQCVDPAASLLCCKREVAGSLPHVQGQFEDVVQHTYAEVVKKTWGPAPSFSGLLHRWWRCLTTPPRYGLSLW
jgi:hypothetical protein